MGYSRYFGMRSFENVVRDGRFRVPKTGTPFKIGAPVQIDPANPGRMKAVAEAVSPNAGMGVVIFEHIQNKSDALTTTFDSPYDQVPLDQYAQIMHGVGTKVWFRNVANKTLYDGRTQQNGTLLDSSLADLSSLTPGTGLVPAGGGLFRATDDSATADVGGKRWLTVEQVNPTTGLIEARFEF